MSSTFFGRRPRAASAAILLASLAPVLLNCAPAHPRPPDVARRPFMLADYNREVRELAPRADGIRHVDTNRTIERLRHANVTTYFYLVFHAATDWTDFVEEFLPAAEQAGIRVWVYLVPPSECCSLPFGGDFARWAEAIARQSLRHRNLEGWAIDDFASNLTTFTPEYTRKLRDAARRVNPALRFFAVLYHDDYSAGFLDAYAPHLDGAIFPYTIDFDDASGVERALRGVAEQLAPYDLELVLMIYATKMSVAAYPPSAAYVAGGLRAGLDAMTRGEILGVTTYALAKELEQETCGFTRHLDLVVPSETPTRPGDFVEANQTIRPDPDAHRYRLRFFEQDSYPAGTAGYHFKQLLIDGATVWDADVASDDALSWTERTVDLTPHLQGRSSATLTFRLYDKKGVSNFGVRVSVAGLEATGFTIDDPEFTMDRGWGFASRGPGSAGRGESGCDPERQRHVYEAVRDLYGRYRTRAR